jgi:hypothetical protein
MIQMNAINIVILPPHGARLWQGIDRTPLEGADADGVLFTDLETKSGEKNESSGRSY